MGSAWRIYWGGRRDSWGFPPGRPDKFPSDLGRRGLAGPLGVRGTSGLEQGDLVESCCPALEESQSARGDLRVVTEPRTSIGVLVCRPQESAGGRLDPAGEPVPPVLQVHPPHPEIGRAHV